MQLPTARYSHYLHKAAEVEAYISPDLNTTKEFDTLGEAFAQHLKYFSYFTGLDALANNNAGLQNQVSALLKVACAED